MTDKPDPVISKPEEEAMRKEARERAKQCMDEISDVLGRHQCRIQPMLTSEPVGSGPGAKALMGATWAVLPEVVE